MSESSAEAATLVVPEFWRLRFLSQANSTGYDQKKVHDLERLLFAKFANQPLTYKKQAIRLLFNLAQNGPYLNSIYSAEQLVEASDHDLAKGTAIDKQEQSEMETIAQYQGLAQDFERQRNESESGEEFNNNRPVCRKCHSTSVQHLSLQTCSADESMTHFFQCEKCGTKWKTGK
jgi:transcription elongation factor S-II